MASDQGLHCLLLMNTFLDPQEILPTAKKKKKKKKKKDF